MLYHDRQAKFVRLASAQQGKCPLVFRSLILAGLAFAWGSPQFTDLRPDALDVPLVTFHHEVKSVARDAVFAVQSVDTVRNLRFMDGYFDAVIGRLNG